MLSGPWPVSVWAPACVCLGPHCLVIFFVACIEELGDALTVLCSGVDMSFIRDKGCVGYNQAYQGLGKKMKKPFLKIQLLKQCCYLDWDQDPGETQGVEIFIS